MKRVIIFFSVVLMITEMGCKKGYLDINDNPNSASGVTPELVLPTALVRTAARQINAFTFVSGWMGQWAISGSYAISNNDFTTYQQTTNFGNGLWAGLYDNLEDYDYVEQKSAVSGNTFFQAAAKVGKAYDFQQLVDMFGNVPYTDAFKGTAVILPTYDKAEDIYDALIVSLNEAIDLFKASPAATRPNDALFGGDITKWLQFSNTLKLRILMRQSEIGKDSYIQSEISKIEAEGSGFLDADAAVNPGYLNADGKQNPFWDFNYNATGTYTNDFWRANQFSILFLKNNNDPRLARLYAPTTGGLFQGNYIGQPSGAFVGSASSVFGPGLLKAFSQPAVIFSASETDFLQAEAVLKGWLPGGNSAAKDLYEAGVAASFTYLGAGDASVYLSQAGNSETTWDEASDKLALVIRQKWVALNSVTPFEEWADYRRLHLPADIPLTQSPFVDVLSIPVRIIYPTIEFTTNAANVAAQGTIDHHTSKLFWTP